MLDENTDELSRLRNNFYRDNYYRILKFLYFLAVVIFLLIIILFYILKTTPKTNFYATTPDGRVIKLTGCISPDASVCRGVKQSSYVNTEL